MTTVRTDGLSSPPHSSPGTVSGDRALTVAVRLLEPQAVSSAVPGLQGASLSQGLAGTALLHARLAAIDPVFEEAAVKHWEQAARISMDHEGGISGIHSGRGALAASLIIGSFYLSDPDRHRHARASGARWLAERALHLARWQGARIREGRTGTPWHVYDLINGLSGIGRVLLAACEAGHTEAEPGLLAARDALTTMISTGDGPRPGWWRPTPENERAAADPHNPDGANTGLAHGIAGPIAFLTACEKADRGGTATRTAIHQASAWLLRWRDGDSWPPQITWENVAHGTATMSDRGRRDAWCYGGPGVGGSLIRAGEVLGNDRLVEAGSRAHAALADRLADQWDVEGPTLCHGYAGVLCSVGGDHPAGTSAAHRVLTAFDTGDPFGFRHVQGTNRFDQPGLLVGAAGTAMALADHAQLAAPEVSTRWDALLLLS